MNQETYRRAMENFEPDPGLRARVSAAVEAGVRPRRPARPVRTALLAAAVCAALVGTAGAVGLAARQAHVTYLDRERFQKEYGEYLEENGCSPDNYNDATYTGRDFAINDVDWWENWWRGPAGELLEETPGTAEDGWTARRVFESDVSAASFGLRRGQRYLETRYKAERASDYHALFDRWDLSWVEERYTVNPYGIFARTIADGDRLLFLGMGGEYLGEGGASFNLTYSWDGSYTYEDEYRAVGNKQFAELYATADGMEAAIEMDTSETGKSVFWVSLKGGHSAFSMHGTQIELEEIHAILDSLNLSQVLDYDPSK